MAARSRTNDSEKSGTPSAADHFDFVSGDHIAATETITFVIKRAPFSESIQSLQNLQLVAVR